MEEIPSRGINLEHRCLFRVVSSGPPGRAVRGVVAGVPLPPVAGRPIVTTPAHRHVPAGVPTVLIEAVEREPLTAVPALLPWLLDFDVQRELG